MLIPSSIHSCCLLYLLSVKISLSPFCHRMVAVYLISFDLQLKVRQPVLATVHPGMKYRILALRSGGPKAWPGITAIWLEGRGGKSARNKLPGLNAAPLQCALVWMAS